MRHVLPMMAGVFFLSSVTGFAHHSFSAEFDHSKRITLQGVITSVAWSNPHVFYYVDVKVDDGTVVNWALETMGPNQLAKTGWTRDSLKPGDEVVVEAYLAKDGSHLADGRKVMLSNGHSVNSRMDKRAYLRQPVN